MAQLGRQKDIEPQTTYTMSVQIITVTTAGKMASSGAQYTIEVPSRGPDTVMEWTSTTESLDELIDKAHRLLKLYGGTIAMFSDKALHRDVVDPFVDPNRDRA